MIQSLILVLALCADTFGASLAYGANRIKVSPGKVLLLKWDMQRLSGIGYGGRLSCSRMDSRHHSQDHLRREPVFSRPDPYDGLYGAKMDQRPLPWRLPLPFFAFRSSCNCSDLERSHGGGCRRLPESGVEGNPASWPCHVHRQSDSRSCRRSVRGPSMDNGISGVCGGNSYDGGRTQDRKKPFRKAAERPGMG